MTIQEKIKKLQELPEPKKKIVFFSVMAVAVLIVGVFGFFATKNNIAKIGESVKNINLPKFDINPQDLGINLPNMDLNSVSEGDAGIVSQDQNADWKTYANEEYGFEVKYPPNLSIKENINTNTDVVSVIFIDNSFNAFPIYFGNSKEKNIVEMINPKSSDYVDVTKGILSINNINWSTVEEVDIPVEGVGTAGSLLNVYTEKGNSTYIFQCGNCDAQVFGDFGTNKKSIFDQIILTFKFTK